MNYSGNTSPEPLQPSQLELEAGLRTLGFAAIPRTIFTMAIDWHEIDVSKRDIRQFRRNLTAKSPQLELVVDCNPPGYHCVVTSTPYDDRYSFALGPIPTIDGTVSRLDDYLRSIG